MRTKAFLLVALVGFLLCACASLETNAYRTIGSVAVSVDTAMHGWGLYVQQKQLTDTQQAPVRDAYNKYVAVMKSVQAEITIYRSKPSGANTLTFDLKLLTSTATNVLQTINTFPK